jgi:hypothetical protein
MTLLSVAPFCGLIVVGSRQQPTITLDICHPLQAADHTQAAVVIAPAVSVTAFPAPPCGGRIGLPRIAALEGCATPPDPPPPKARV